MIPIRLTTYMRAEYARRNVTLPAQLGIHTARSLLADALQHATSPQVPVPRRTAYRAHAKRIQAAMATPALREMTHGFYLLGDVVVLRRKSPRLWYVYPRALPFNVIQATTKAQALKVAHETHAHLSAQR